MLTIDGSNGEGGGQILRTALALSQITQTPIRIHSVRAGRDKPGLLRQHLTCVQAAATICGAEVSGASLGSQEIEFRPGRVRAGSYHFAIGSAGSTTLVLQTVLYGLLSADGPSDLTLEGGTHNPKAPPFEALERGFLPLLARMGARVSVRLLRAGFYPAGGGRISVHIEPAPRLGSLDLTRLGSPRARRATASVWNLSYEIAQRELAVLGRRLGLSGEELRATHHKDSDSAGNTLAVEIEQEELTEVFNGIGEKGVPAEQVAEKLATEVEEYLAAQVPVGRHLADQILLPLALGSGGAFRTLSLSLHARTQIAVLRRFLPIPISVHEEGAVTRVELG